MSDLFDITGRVAMVTGGSRGLGRQIAEGLLESGATVIVANRNEADGSSAARELQERFGGHVIAVSMDVTDAESVRQAVAFVENTYGTVDILVNCAGISLNTPLLLSEESISSFRRTLDVNVIGLFQCTVACIPGMKSRGWGRIINISSIYGMVGVDRSLYVDETDESFGLYGYTASKGAVCNLTRDLASSLSRHGVTVNSILPATFVTDQNRHLFEGDVLTRIKNRTPAGRVGSADDLKGVATFLASNASSYVTGQMLAVDGGWLAW